MSCNNGMSFFPSNFIVQSSYEDYHPHQSPISLSPFLPSSSLPQDLHGFGSFLGERSLDSCCEMNGEDEYSDDGSQMGEKKRRLNIEQVRTLEKSFEFGNKLEPERKMQLACALGLQPRQVAIWFQNRRARWKTKQLEKDYDVLKLKFDALKAENEILQIQNQKLQAEIIGLKSGDQTESINLNKETEGSCSNNNSDSLTLDISTLPPPSLETGSQPPSSATEMTTMQFFQNSTSGQNLVKEENNNISNMLCVMDDHSGFWPWLD